MSVTMLNGKPRRKQLSDELDRFDGIIDALAGGLPEAVAAATRDGARQAIAQVLREVLADPALLATLRGGVTPAPAAPPADPKPSAWARLKAAVRAAATRVAAKVMAGAARLTERAQPVVSRLTARVRRVREWVAAARRLFELGWRVKRAAAVGLGVAAAVLVACQFSHAAASALAAAGSGLIAAAAHLGVWARNTARRLLISPG